MLRCVPNATRMSKKKRPQYDTVPNPTRMSKMKRPQCDTVPNPTKMSKMKRPQRDTIYVYLSYRLYIGFPLTYLYF